MKFDFKKEDKAFYPTITTPTIVDVPTMSFLVTDGTGNPNTSAAYAAAVEMLFRLSYAIKMANKHVLDYIAAPLEGLWRGTQIGDAGFNKDQFIWTLMIRQPSFVTSQEFKAAQGALTKHKPKRDVTSIRLERLTEGRCVQALHIGPYDDEPATIAAMKQFAAQHGYEADLDGVRRHHEIYLSDPRKTVPEKLKTVIRQPVKLLIPQG